MSGIYIAGHENGALEIGKGKPEFGFGVTSESEISRDELIGFIAYLREKEEICIENRVEIRRTMFNRYSCSVSEIAKGEFKVIKNAASAEEAYAKVAVAMAKKNSNWRLIPEFAYIMTEDLTEYLLSVGLSGEEALELTRAYQNRTFKRSKWEKDPRLSENFKIWAASSGGPLVSRRYLVNLFDLEYLGFRQKNSLTPEAHFSIIERSTLGAYNSYGYISSRLFGQGPDSVILGYRDQNNSVDKEKLITLGKMFCLETGIREIAIRNMEEDKVTVIRRAGRKTDGKIPEHAFSGGMAKAGVFGDYDVGIYTGDTGLPHFHIEKSNFRKKIAVDLQNPGYIRHNPGDKALLTKTELKELCEWLSDDSEKMAKAGAHISNYDMLWAQNNPYGEFEYPRPCPDYSGLETEAAADNNEKEKSK